jgi:hypothetical protein
MVQQGGSELTLIIFTEEPSMKATLHCLIPKLGLDARNVKVIGFDGVGDMENALPRQLRALRASPEKVLILRDNDNGNCAARKSRLMQMAAAAGVAPRTKVRIVCQMLEAWFIGDVDALLASRHFKKSVPRRLERCDPDEQPNPKKELSKLRDDYREITAANAVARHLNPEVNRSASFRNTIRAIRTLAT